MIFTVNVRIGVCYRRYLVTYFICTNMTKFVINSSTLNGSKYKDLEGFLRSAFNVDSSIELEKKVENNRIIFKSIDDSFIFDREEKYYSDEISGYSFKSYTVTNCDFIPIDSQEEVERVMDQNLDRNKEFPEYETF